MSWFFFLGAKMFFLLEIMVILDGSFKKIFFLGKISTVLQGTALVVQWLRLHAPNAGGLGSVPGWGTKIPYAACLGRKKKKIVYEFPH